MPRFTDPDLATATIHFDGEAVAAVPGESIAAALTAAGKLTLRRDRNDKPRGMLCGMGSCFECRVQVDGGDTVRACLTRVEDGMRLKSLGYREPLSRSPVQTEHHSQTCDVIVVGAGPAGMSAATRLAEAGQSVVVLDERNDSGGQYFKQRIEAVQDDGYSDRQYADGAALIQRLRNSGAKLEAATTVWAAFRTQDRRLDVHATSKDTAFRFSCQHLVVATGAYESVPAFPGWTLPGVMTTGAAQSLVRAYAVGAANRVLVAGNGPLNLQLACELLRGGVEIAAVVESAPPAFPSRVLHAAAAGLAAPRLILQGLGYLRLLARHKVPVLNAHHVIEADGSERVERVTVCRIDENGTFVSGSKKQFEVDAVCLGYRLRPSLELLQSMGCEVTTLESGVVTASRDEVGATSVDGVYAIGDGAKIGGAQLAQAEGWLVADRILGRAPDQAELRRLRKHQKFQHHLWSVYRAATPNALTPATIACRCESVLAETVIDCVQAGASDMDALKRQTRAGMGVCQGRYCQPAIASLLKEHAGHMTGSQALPATRIPIKPVNVQALLDEQPEWSGYRAVNLKSNARQSTAQREALADVDVAIVGAGIIGVATAMYLARKGVNVLLLERGRANGEASGGNAGSLHLQLLPFDFNDSTTASSPAVATLPLQKAGIKAWQDLEKELHASFELQISGGMMLATSTSEMRFLEKKAALEQSVGIDVALLSAAGTRERLPDVTDQVAGSLFCPGEGKINPMLATPVLLSEALECGATLLENTSVLSIEKSAGKFRLATTRGQVTCDKLVNAAGGWSADIAAMLGIGLPVRSAPQQMLVTQALQPVLPFLLSMAGRHLTMKQASNGNLLIGGGWPAAYNPRTRKGEVLPDSVGGNLWVAQKALPGIGGTQLIRSWATTGVMIDGAPIIDGHRSIGGFYSAVGANGYTMGPAIGRIISRLVMGQQTDPDISAFSVRRFD